MNDRPPGFTLVEVALVLLIMGVLLVALVPRLPELTATRSEASADRLATLISYLHDEASLRGETYRLTLDLDKDRYSVEVRAEAVDNAADDDFTERWDPYARSGVLPEGVRLISLTSATGVQRSGAFELLFAPEGNREDVAIVLGDGGDRTYALDYRAITGRVDVRAAGPGSR